MCLLTFPGHTMHYMGVACLQDHQICASRHRHGPPPQQHQREARCSPSVPYCAAGLVQPSSAARALQPATQAGMRASLSAQATVGMLGSLKTQHMFVQ